jgi:hypothetical protein
MSAAPVNQASAHLVLVLYVIADSVDVSFEISTVVNKHCMHVGAEVNSDPPGH